ncbi:TetR/AcrR family transcriptional regulator [Levilinea saccharolytica]|uniref:TetR/AcrR family transcriptional regulator n=1 Tax=Levilinea saccharolytica TaxID=229921 RepID=UPI000782C631|nr:TetR/AcrR family transcriptional regulator [Levilinea saccharolytica]GAP18851.1 transcriptional regulator, TetR family [Levilinea saccharolytica]
MPRGFSENQMYLLQEKLISAAFDALSSSGVRKTPVGDLAKSAGISTGAFYKFFPSKEALFFAVYERTEESLKKEFVTRLDTSPEVSKNVIRDVLKQLLLSEKMQSFLRLMQKEERMYLIRGVDPAVVEAHLQKDLAFLNSVIERLKLRGVQVTGNVNLILSFLQALFVLDAARDELGAEASLIIDAFVDTFINTIIA